MAFATVTFENKRTGQIREAPIGFSWTTLFFGPFPAIFRSDWPSAAIILLISIFTGGLSNLVFCFIYNKMYAKRLLQDGFEVSGSTIEIATVEARIGQRLSKASG